MRLLSVVLTLCATCCSLRSAEAAAQRALVSSCTTERNECVADEDGCAPCMTAVARNATAVPAVCDAEGLASFRASLSSCDENESGSAMTALEECVAVHAAGSCNAGLSDPCAAQNRDYFTLAAANDVNVLHLLPCHANKQLNACFDNEECALCSESLANATQQHSCDTAQDNLLDLVPADCNLDEGLLFELIECEFEVFKNCEPESVVSAAPAAAAVQR
eukprot:8699-Heterococcus_DN1.PRE.1